MHFPTPSFFSLRWLRLPLAAAALTLVACGGDADVDDEEGARLSYLGLDASVDRALKLGFQGFNAAQSANIPTQTEAGSATGEMVVAGQVDQGASDNKGMRLTVALTDYSDGPVKTADEEELELAYHTDTPAALELQMKGLPNAALTGTFIGKFIMVGGLEGPVDLNLSITGKTQDQGGVIQREPGTTRIAGTATSDFGTFDVDVTR